MSGLVHFHIFLLKLISGIEVLPKCTASCSFSAVIISKYRSQILMVLIHLKVIFKVRNVQFEPLLST